ncbi:hypothetical protein DBR32_11950 [Taibaiella sp. KBW10]|uniref:tetratricopeptide repeat protein n=1 Tax=Taibaiella sp. KBW10 TaxID=2153357 RepID=UPI000F5A804C|nr:hypothetical protein [Taibaiella sp. KBW10]RQO30280.1 hypothetical protein DBR32_11950 [Taibaiella sp. KBW10]
MKPQSFEQKLFNTVVLLLLLKVFLSMFTSGGLNVRSFLIALLILVLIIVIIRIIMSGRNTRSHSSSGGGANVLLSSNMFNRIQQEYETLAANYLKQGAYRKAADIYLRLLKNPHMGAQTLEQGKLYNEAAIIYLDKLQNKNKAAECYELGRDYTRAIPLFKELDNKEKVGDLYNLLADREQANHYYQLVTDDYIEKGQYIKASLMYKQKMGLPGKAKDLLWKGWETRKDAFNCLNNYLTYLDHDHEVMDTLERVAATSDMTQKEILLQVLKYEYNKYSSLEVPIRDMAYTLIAERLPSNPRIAEQLKDFVPGDKVLSNDISRYLNKGNKAIGF